MIKLRLKKCGRKQQSSYRIVVMTSTSKRDGKAIEELGFYNPQTNESNLNVNRITIRLSQGAQPTDTVKNLLKRANILKENK
jgi:small subunit ribosomal protein S16